MPTPEQRERYRIRHWKVLRQKLYGITPEEHGALLAKQNNVCAICGLPETNRWRDKVRELSVDHCHITGVVRGLLCARCNLVLGKCNDDPTLLRMMIAYLEKLEKYRG